jgi:hypothetical protein
MADRKAFLLRIDPQIYAALHRWADDEFRSLNGQIEYLLRNNLIAAGRLRKEGVVADIEEKSADESVREQSPSNQD